MSKPIALSKNRTVNYVLEDNRADEPDEQVRFQIRTLPFNVRMDIFNSLAVETGSGDNNMRADVGRKYRLACKHGIAGWAHLVDADGDEIEWVGAPKKLYGVEVIDDDCLALLPDDVIVELGNAINELSTSGAHEVGK